MLNESSNNILVTSAFLDESIDIVNKLVKSVLSSILGTIIWGTTICLLTWSTAVSLKPELMTLYLFLIESVINMAGYFIIRYPDITDRHTVRLGFVIVDDSRRGQGIGKNAASSWPVPPFLHDFFP